MYLPADLASKELLPGMAENHQDCSNWSVCMHHQWLNILHVTPGKTQQILTEHQSSMCHLLLHEWLHLILTKALRSGPLVSRFWDGKTKVQGDGALVEGHTLHTVASARVRTCLPKHLPLELMLFLFYPLGLSEWRQGAFLHRKPIGKTTRKKQLSFLPTDFGGHQL